MKQVQAATDSDNGPGNVRRPLLEAMRPCFVSDGLVREIEQQIAGQWFACGLQRAAHAKSGRQARFKVEIACALAMGGGDE